MSDSNPEQAVQSTFGTESSDPEQTVRKSPREITYTEKGLEWQISLQTQKFKMAVSEWRSIADRLEASLADTEDVSILRAERETLLSSFRHLQSIYSVLCPLLKKAGKQTDIEETYDSIQTRNSELSSRTVNRVSDIELESCRAGSAKSQSRSHLSRTSRESAASRKSQIAVLKAKLKHIDAIALSKAEVQKAETLMKIDVEQAKLETLDETENKSQVVSELPYIPESDNMNKYVEEYVNRHSTEAMVGSLGDGDKVTNVQSLVVTAPSCLSEQPIRLSVTAPIFRQTPTSVLKSYDYSDLSFPTLDARPIVSGHQAQTTYPTWSFGQSIPSVANYGRPNIVSQHLPNYDPCISAPLTYSSYVPPVREPICSISTSARDVPQTSRTSIEEGLLNLSKSLVDQVHLGRLPAPEPSVFYGDPLQYPGWKRAFETLIEQKRIPTCERLYYLRKYLGGSVRDDFENYFVISTDESYEAAKALLEERYGDPFVVADAFRDKLYAWPKIRARDGVGLRKFSDFLVQCSTAMNSVRGLAVLNDDRENKKMLQKLPEWVVLRWGRLVFQWKQERREFPPFKVFSDFLVREAKFACDPITSPQAQSHEHVEDRARNDKRHAKLDAKTRIFSTEVVKPVEKSVKPSDKTPIGKATRKQVCPFCNENHHLDDCEPFMALTIDERKTFVFEKRLCFGCLGTSHVSKKCRRRRKCKTCFKLHPTCLHASDKISRNQLDDKDQTLRKSVSSNTDVNFMNSIGTVSKSSMIVPVYVSHISNPQNEILIYALLDTQSDTTFVLDQTCESLGVSGPDIKLGLSTMFSKDQMIQSRKIAGLTVRGYNSSLKIALPVAYSRDIMPANRNHIPTPDMANCWPNLSKLADELLPLQSCDIGLLIGYDCPRALVPREVIPPVGDGPYGQLTDLGWSIVGILDSIENQDGVPSVQSHVIACGPIVQLPNNTTERDSVLFCFPTRAKEMINPNQVSRMMELDFNERVETDTPVSLDDRCFLEKVKSGIHQRDDGHYEMPLPFKVEPKLPNNRAAALHRLKSLRRRFKSDQKYRSDYLSFMRDLIAKGFAERIAVEENPSELHGTVWYIPHHGVYNSKKPGKIRVVFDCSHRFKGHSLNDQLLQGPDLTNTLIGVLCRFRQEPVAFICDVEQMFYQFYVSPEHRDYLRFLWWEGDNFETDPIEYRMTVHLFGATSSPGCANYGLKQIADDHESEFGCDAADFLRKDFYVDDGLKSLASTEEAISLIDNSKSMCKKGGLRLHKFVSNKKTVLEAIEPCDRAKDIQNIDLLCDSMPIERALGVLWCIESDTFQFRLTFNDRPLTRRGVLSTVSSVYDPLGFIAPIVLVGKQILQDMCRKNLDWDDPIPLDLATRWERWKVDILSVGSLKIQRCVRPEHFGDIVTKELHHFSDACTSGYGQCSYLRIVNDRQEVHCSLIMAKSRVTPLKTVTIPRLELTAAVVSVKVSAMLQRELQYENVPEYFWTDSNVVLGYIANDSRRFHVFVANRIQQIRDRTEHSQWYHVDSKDNPADLASRGAKVQEMVESHWFTGPDFLSETNIAVHRNVATVSPVDPELRKCQGLSTVTERSFPSILERLEYFSDWHRARKAIALCMKLKAVLSCRSSTLAVTTLTVCDIQNAEVEIIRHVQREAFPDEIKTLRSLKSERKHSGMSRELKRSSPVFRIDPFLDENDIMHVGGRLQKSDFGDNYKHPVILPKNGHITDLIVRHFHNEIHHQGRGMTVNAIRENGYWIMGCSSIVARHIFKCVTCRKLRGSQQVQKMANLPGDRLEPAPPFSYCAVDFFGPWFVKEGRKHVKRYGVIFTCLGCRAIHIETANTLDTCSFINALRRFLAIRGPIRHLRSDRGTNFIGADKELKTAIAEIDDLRVREFLLQNGSDFEFKFNVPSASHMGGVWERQIRSIRSVLCSIMYKSGSQLDDESLRTFMHEAAAIVNSRPITVETLNDPTSIRPLSPNQLLTMKSRVILPPPGDFQNADLYSRKRWRRVQYLANVFWTRWQREYLQTLQFRKKWNVPKRNVRVGDVVLIKEENAPRNEWRLGLVSYVDVAVDGHVRKAKVSVGTTSPDSPCGRRFSTLERPIHKLVLILESENSENK